MKKIALILSMCFAFCNGFAANENTTSKDPEIVAFMIVLNQNEIDAGKLTQHKKVNNEVKSYADLMVKEHSDNLNDTKKLSKKEKIKPLKTDMVKSLEAKGKEEKGTLKPLDGAAYESAYIDAMVNGHQDALNNIDSFLKDVSNPQLKTHLQDTRKHVELHLAKAKEIQTNLKK